MAHESVGQRLDEVWSMPGTHLIDDLAHHLAHGQYIHAIYTFSLDAIGAGRLSHVRIECDGPFSRCPHTVAVVLANENHRKFPQGCQIECLVCLAAWDRPFAEEADGHEIERLILGRECEA